MIRHAIALGIVIFMWLFLSLVLVEWALGHEAPSGWMYHGYCCGGQDCQPIPDSFVQIVPNGYIVTIPYGSHITATDTISRFFSHEGVHHSHDGQYHACIVARTQEMRCFYVPEFMY